MSEQTTTTIPSMAQWWKPKCHTFDGTKSTMHKGCISLEHDPMNPINSKQTRHKNPSFHEPSKETWNGFLSNKDESYPRQTLHETPRWTTLVFEVEVGAKVWSFGGLWESGVTKWTTELLVPLSPNFPPINATRVSLKKKYKNINYWWHVSGVKNE